MLFLFVVMEKITFHCSQNSNVSLVNRPQRNFSPLNPILLTFYRLLAWPVMRKQADRDKPHRMRCTHAYTSVTVFPDVARCSYPLSLSPSLPLSLSPLSPPPPPLSPSPSPSLSLGIMH